jgi:hypothetical protein
LSRKREIEKRLAVTMIAGLVSAAYVAVDVRGNEVVSE